MDLSGKDIKKQNKMANEQSWTEKAEKEFINLGYKKGRKTGSEIIFSPSICKNKKTSKKP